MVSQRIFGRVAVAATALAAGLGATAPASALSPSFPVVCAGLTANVARGQQLAFDLACSVTGGGPVDGYVLVSGPTKAEAFTLDPQTGSVTYQAPVEVTGTDSFTFKAVVDGVGESATQQAVVTLDNTKPVCAAPPALALSHDRAATISVTCSDSDNDDLVLQQGTVGAAHGTVSVSGTSVTYTPQAGFTGADVFTVSASDGYDLSSEAQVSVTVVNSAPQCNVASVNVRHDKPTFVPVQCNDADGDPVALVQSAPAQHGTVTVAQNGFVYQPSAGYLGADTFMFAGTDALSVSEPTRVNLQVTNTTPACSAGRSLVVRGQVSVPFVCADPDGDLVHTVVVGKPRHGTVKVLADHLVYTPDRGYRGTDSFAVAGDDGLGRSATSTFEVKVRPGRPAAVDGWVKGRGATVVVACPKSELLPCSGSVRITVALPGKDLTKLVDLGIRPGKQLKVSLALGKKALRRLRSGGEDVQVALAFAIERPGGLTERYDAQLSLRNLLV